MPLYGLVGFPLSHSFSKQYFTEKFARENLKNYAYQNFEIKNIEELRSIVAVHSDLEGLNVTVPHKTSIIDLLDELDATATAINAVNTITIKDGKLKGYNTDSTGFEQSLLHFMGNKKHQALILGSGGSAKAVAFILEKLQMNYFFVSRTLVNEKTMTYSMLTQNVLSQHKLIINCTPLGKFPDHNTFPPIDYELLTAEHFLFDLNYNPEKTLFMHKGMEKKATVQNGYEMLTLQANASWNIWTTNGLKL